jgi:hypothetical protein
VVQDSVADKIRKRLESGQLPREGLSKVWAGFGSGQVCAGCDRSIHRTQILHEIERDGITIYLHRGCAAIWVSERQRRGWLQRSPSDAQPAAGSQGLQS